MITTLITIITLTTSVTYLLHLINISLQLQPLNLRTISRFIQFQIIPINHICDLSNQKSTKMVNSLLKLIKQTLESSKNMLISDFCKFYVINKKERLDRNPATKDDMVFRPRQVATFKFSGKLGELMNEWPSLPCH